VDGRFGRCQGCGEVVVLCGVCASVRARCGACAEQRRRVLHRQANRRYGRSPDGRASGRVRQARWRAVHRGGVTDVLSTEAVPGSTPVTSPSCSEVEASRGEEVVADETQSRPSPSARTIANLRCARCGRVLSGRVRPSERSPERHRRRPRQPYGARAP
jgi:hypothetical protein